MLDFLVSGLKWFFINFGQWVFDKATNLIFPAINNSGFNSGGLWVRDFWNDLNYFVPVNETLSIFTVLLSVWLTFFLIKIILKLIPTVY